MPRVTPITPRKARIGAAFAAAAETYEGAAELQRRTARSLARRIRRLTLPARPLVLEIGCGTGFFTRALRARLPHARWVISDLAPTMVARCRQGLGRADDALFLAMDGERPAVAGGFDLIAANMAFQWFEDLEASLGRLAGLLKPKGHVAFSTLSRQTFREWREAHRALGLAAATPAFPSLTELEAMGRAFGRGVVEEETILRTYDSGLAFVRALKATGSQTPAPGSRPLAPGIFRRVLGALNGTETVTMTYQVAYGLFTKEGP